MVQQQPQILRPETLVEEFKKNGVTHIITIPDSETNYLYELMLEQDWLDVVPVSREGETMGVALGLNVAGKVPVVPHSEHRHDGIRRLHSRHGAGQRLSASDGHRLSRLDAAWQHARHGGDIHRAVPKRIPHQLLSGRARRRRRPHFRSVRRGAEYKPSSGRAGRRRVSRIQ